MRFFLLALAFFALPAKASFNYDPITKSLETTLEAGDQNALAEKIDQAIDAIVKHAINRLDANDRVDLGSQLWKEYEPFRGTVYTVVSSKEEIGDYAPLSEFLVKLYDTLEATLGSQLCRMARCEDIRTVNYGVPVTFHFKTITQDISVEQYGEHFEPLSGVVAYWVTDATCMVTTEGGGFWFICQPAALAAEFICRYYISPQFTKPLHDKFYPAEG